MPAVELAASTGPRDRRDRRSCRPSSAAEARSAWSGRAAISSERVMSRLEIRPEPKPPKAPSGPVSRILYPAVRRSRSFLWSRRCRRARAADPEAAPPRRRERDGRPTASLFGLAPHGVYRAPAVAGGAVRSYRTVSPLPLPKEPGGLFSVALSFASPRPGVSRHAARVEFGLSSPVTRGDHTAHSDVGSIAPGRGVTPGGSGRRTATSASRRRPRGFAGSRSRVTGRRPESLPEIGGRRHSTPGVPGAARELPVGGHDDHLLRARRIARPRARSHRRRSEAPE